MGKNVDISVVVPLYKWKKTEHLSNVLQIIRENANYAGELQVELVLVNDSPEEGRISDIEANGIYKVKCIENSEHLGIQKSRIAGAKAAGGNYILFLDQDDVLFENAIKELYNTIKEAEERTVNQNGNERHIIVVSDWQNEVMCLKKNQIVTKAYKSRLNDKDAFILGGNYIGVPGHCLIAKDSIPKGWEHIILENQGADDYLLWLCMLIEGVYFTRCKKILYKHKYSITNFSQNQICIFKSEQEAFERAAEYYNIRPYYRHRYQKFLKYRIGYYELNQKDVRKMRMFFWGVMHPINSVRFVRKFGALKLN